MNIQLPKPLVANATHQILDSSKLQTYQDCPRKFFYEYVLGWREDRENNHLAYGEAWHDAREYLMHKGYSNEQIATAYKLFLDSYRKKFSAETDDMYSPKTPANALTALAMYADRYAQLDKDIEVLYTEIAGSVPINGEDVLTFRIDAIIRKDGLLWPWDHKTGSRLDSKWRDQWLLKVQMGTYAHAAMCCFGPENVGGVIVDGTFFYKAKDPEFVRVEVKKSPQMMEVWLWNVNRWVSQLKEEFKQLSMDRPSLSMMKSFPQNTESCTKYFGCPFIPFCTAWANPLARMDYKDGNAVPPPGYKQEWWNPEDRLKPAKTTMDLEKKKVKANAQQ